MEPSWLQPGKVGGGREGWTLQAKQGVGKEPFLPEGTMSKSLAQGGARSQRCPAGPLVGF